LISGKPPVKPPVTPAVTTTTGPANTVPNTGSASSGADSSKITELFDEKKKPVPAPPTVTAKDGTPTPKTDTVKPALSQAEQDAAQRKALEDMLKG
jgi:hypothetical protein